MRARWRRLASEPGLRMLGAVEETVRLVAPREVPAELAALRARAEDVVTEGERANEDVIHYRRRTVVRSEAARIQAHTGRPLTDAWMAEFYDRRNARLAEELTAIAHIHPTIERVHAHHGGRIACASGADRHKVELQLAKVGLAAYFEGRIFSGHEMSATKPAPDVYLAAAEALQVHPARCAVVEDTLTGVMAGVAAGATVFAYAPLGDGAPLVAAGAAHVFAGMADLPGLLGC